MPSRTHSIDNPWQARVRVGDRRYALGVYPTRAEAFAIEQEFTKTAEDPELNSDLEQEAKRYVTAARQQYEQRRRLRTDTVPLQQKLQLLQQRRDHYYKQISDLTDEFNKIGEQIAAIERDIQINERQAAEEEAAPPPEPEPKAPTPERHHARATVNQRRYSLGSYENPGDHARILAEFHARATSDPDENRRLALEIKRREMPLERQRRFNKGVPTS